MLKEVKVWLCLSAMMCVLMTMIGGYTRLTESGLSIVEWKPVTGIVPPISTSDWSNEFSKYQLSPEYKLINYNISTDEFKFIYLVEYTHRLMARVTGLIIIVPLLWFYISGKLHIKRDRRYILIPFLLLMQGFVGWCMVKSGLINIPYVNHFKLATHLILAVLLYSYILSLLFDCRFSIKRLTILSLVIVQVFFGGLVAGLDAGLIYNTFPLMEGNILPLEIVNLNYITFWQDAAAVQFIHRINAYITAIVVIYYAFAIRSHDKKSFWLVIATIFLQFMSGVMTLIMMVPISLGLLHQIGALILIGALLYSFRNREKY